MEIDAPTQPAGELGGCLRRPVCAPARRTARGLSWSTLAYFCVIVIAFFVFRIPRGVRWDRRRPRARAPRLALGCACA